MAGVSAGDGRGVGGVLPTASSSMPAVIWLAVRGDRSAAFRAELAGMAGVTGVRGDADGGGAAGREGDGWEERPGMRGGETE